MLKLSQFLGCSPEITAILKEDQLLLFQYFLMTVEAKMNLYDL
jgi:hypothetical protein